MATLTGEVVVFAPMNDTTPPGAVCETVPTLSCSVPVVRVSATVASPGPIESPAKVCDVSTASGLPTTPRAELASATALPTGSRFVGVARLARLSDSVPPVTVTPPVSVPTSEGFTSSVPVPAFVSPAEPASTNAVALPRVAVPVVTFTVGETPSSVSVPAPWTT